MIHHPSPNHDARPEGTRVDMLVLHYTGMRTGAAALERLCDPAAQVSAHYLIEEDGRVFALVPENLRAWHAGVSYWRGNRNINARSIGIELVNPGHEFGYRPFPPAQMQALAELAQAILSRHPIPARNVVGHSDIAPTRKEDPGELFDWRGLGVGVWPQATLPATAAAEAMLEEFGYDISDPKAALIAFQRHFRPEKLDGVADSETLGRLVALLNLAE